MVVLWMGGWRSVLVCLIWRVEDKACILAHQYCSIASVVWVG